MINNQKRLSIFVPSMRGGGAERSMLRLAKGIAERGCMVDLVLARAKGPYLNEMPKSVRIIDLKASRVLSSLPALVRYLRREQPQALLSTLDYANIVALWARRLTGIPKRLIVNDQNTISFPAKHSRQFSQRITPRLVRLFYPWADEIIGNSQGVADDLSEVTGISRELIKVVYNPVVTLELREKSHAPLDHSWFRNGHAPVFLAVGRLTKQKDFPTLIRAFAQVRAIRPAHLLILGEGPDRQELEELVKLHGLEGDVNMPGFVENPYAYMSRASMFVLSSRWEGLPTVLIEALYCGIPIIATDCPSGPREILNNGQYGQLVPVGDVKALVKAIKNVLNGKAPRPQEESWKPYELEPVVNKYIELLLEN
jgi:glycosyltransferase involved in cell wall biosynthesis